jgi:hypothetical protein
MNTVEGIKVAEDILYVEVQKSSSFDRINQQINFFVKTAFTQCISL